MTAPSPFMILASGLIVALRTPHPGAFRIRDLAHHLAAVNRFAGAARLPYSVAQHSVLVSKLAGLASQPPLTCLFALLHDAHEAIIGDIPEPVARYLFGEDPFNPLTDLKQRLDWAIRQSLGLPEPSDAEARAVKHYDAIAFATEWRDLMPETQPCPVPAQPSSRVVKPLNFDKAEDAFVARFQELAAVLGLAASP